MIALGEARGGVYDMHAGRWATRPQHDVVYAVLVEEKKDGSGAGGGPPKGFRPPGRPRKPRAPKQGDGG